MTDGKAQRPEGSAEREARSEHIPTPEGQGGGEDARELAQRVIDTWGDGNPPIVVLARALLSSPRVEEVRREAITAQSAIDEVENAFLAAARKDFDLLRDIRKRLRSLSPQGG